MKRLWILLAACSMGCAAADTDLRRDGAEALPFYRTLELTPEWIESDAPEYESIHRVGSFALTDQHGSAVTAADLEGGLTVANFFFTMCVEICPPTRGNLERVRAAFQGDERLTLVSHSVMPDVDTADRLDMYAHQHGIDADGWHLLTGDAEQIFALAEQSYLVDLHDGSGYSVASLAHTENVMLLDAALRIRGVYNGTLAMDVNRLIEDIGVLLTEMGEGQ